LHAARAKKNGADDGPRRFHSGSMAERHILAGMT
jgi:hypothetical protein